MLDKKNEGPSRAKLIAGGVLGLMFGGAILVSSIEETLRRQEAGVPVIQTSDLFILAFGIVLLYLGLQSFSRGIRTPAGNKRDA